MITTHRNSADLKILKIFVCLLVTFFAGCAGVTIKDNLPPSSPKGYADIANYSYGYANIYSVQDGKKVKEGALTYTGEILRLARTPGNYAFMIEHRDAFDRKYSKLVNVNILRDMLTFITVDRTIVEVEDYMSGRTEATWITYKATISDAKTPAPMHFESEPNKADILNNLLADPDWRARLYAIGYLEKMGNSNDESLIRRVKTLATDDPHKSVRKKAAALLKGLGIDASQNLLLLENFESNNRRWINPHGSYDYFYNDEFLFRSGKGGCENEIIKTPLELPRDFDVELVSTWKSGTTDNEYGLLIGSDEKNFNHFGISGDAQAVVRPVINNESSADLVSWTSVTAIKKHGAAPNSLRVEARGDTCKYFVNDAFIGAITNMMKMNKYVVGLRVCQGQAIAFEQLKISRAPENRKSTF